MKIAIIAGKLLVGFALYAAAAQADAYCPRYAPTNPNAIALNEECDRQERREWQERQERLQQEALNEQRRQHQERMQLQREQHNDRRGRRSEESSAEMAGRGLAEAIGGALGHESEAQRRQGAQSRFNAAHPDARQILADPAFRRWIQASRERTLALQRANEEYDFETADVLFSTWKALRGR